MSKLHKNIRTEARVAGQDYPTNSSPSDSPDLVDVFKALGIATEKWFTDTLGADSDLAYIQERWSR